LHHKVQKFSSGTGSPGWSRKKGRKTVVVVVVEILEIYQISWKLSGLVCKFVHLLLVVTILVFQSVLVQNISR